MPSDCKVVFDNPNGVYNTGENLTGHFELITNQTKKIRGIFVTISGYADVKWEVERTRRENDRNINYIVEYENHEIYLDLKQYCLGSADGDLFDLAPGTHNYPFNCRLPLDLPTSFNGKFGEIKYEAIVTVHRGTFTFDNKFKQGFTVIQRLNLNLSPHYKEPQSAQDESVLCCCCCFGCGQGTIDVKLNIPFKGYVSGQKIHYTILVNNDSNTDTEGGNVYMQKKITFKSQRPSVEYRYRTFDLAKKESGRVLKLTKKKFQNSLEIPATPPSTLNERYCIRIEYFVIATIWTGCCARKLTMTIPITIGTVPLQQNLTQTTDLTNVITIQPSAPTLRIDGNDNSDDLPPDYDTVSPPSYADALAISDQFDKKKIEKHQEAPYVPKYPVYYNIEPMAPNLEDDQANSTASSMQRNHSGINYGWI